MSNTTIIQQYLHTIMMSGYTQWEGGNNNYGNNMNGWEWGRREEMSARSLPSCLLFIELLPGFGLAT